MKSCSNCSFPETLALADLSLAAVVHTAGLLVTEAIMADKAPDSPRGAGQDTVRSAFTALLEGYTAITDRTEAILQAAEGTQCTVNIRQCARVDYISAALADLLQQVSDFNGTIDKAMPNTGDTL